MKKQSYTVYFTFENYEISVQVEAMNEQEAEEKAMAVLHSEGLSLEKSYHIEIVPMMSLD